MKSSVRNRIRSLSLAFLLLAVSCFSLYNKAWAAEETGKVHFEIEFAGNLIFNKYDVEMYLDGEMHAAMPHGTDYQGTVTLTKGKHEMAFYKAGDKEVAGIGTFNVSSEESTVLCCIYADKKKISLKDFEIRDDAAIKAKEAKEKAEAEKKAKEEKERKEIAEKTKKLCAALPDNDAAILSAMEGLEDKVISFTGYVAYVSNVADSTVILIRSGSAESKGITGPDFQIICKDVSEIPYTTDSNLPIEKGLELKAEAYIEGYDEEANIIAIQPVRLTSRGSKLIQQEELDAASAEAVIEVQSALNEFGLDCGTPDGKAGQKTYAAIGQYKVIRNLGENNTLDDELITYLRVRPSIERALEEKASAAAAEAAAAVAVAQASGNETNSSPTYIGNLNSKKFHKPGCPSVEKMNESNKRFFYGSREEVIAAGYDPCGNCHP